MADRTYSINFNSNNAAALASIRQLKAELVALEVLAVRVKPLVAGIGVGTAAGITATSRAVGGLNRSLRTTQTRAAGSASALGRMGMTIGTVGASSQATTGQAAGLVAAIARFATLTAAVGGMVKLFGEMGKAIREAREHTEAMADKALGERDKGRELAALMGEPEVNDRVLNRIHAVGMGGGMSFDESNAFLKSFEGSVSAGARLGHIKDADKAEVATEVARYARRSGITAEAAGDIAGVITQHVDLNAQKDASGKLMTPGQAISGLLESAGQQANQQGRGNVSKLMEQEAAIMQTGMNSGRLSSVAQAFALTSAFSNIADQPGRVATSYRQASEIVNDLGKGAGFLKKTGIADEPDDIAKFHKLSQVLTAAEAAYAGPGTFDRATFMKQQGFHNTKGIAMALAIAQEDKDKLLQADVGIASEMTRGGAAASGRNLASMGSKEAQAGVARAQMEFGQWTSGKKEEDETILRMKAAARMEHRGELNRADQKVRDFFESGGGLTEFFGLKSAERERIEAEMRLDLEAKATNAGIDTDAPGMRNNYLESNNTNLRIKPVIAALRAKGVNPLIGGNEGGMLTEARAGDVPASIRAARAKANVMQPGAGPVGAIPGVGSAIGATGDIGDKLVSLLKPVAEMQMMAALTARAAAHDSLSPFVTLPDGMAPPVVPQRA